MKATNVSLTHKQKLRAQATVLTDYSPQSIELIRMNTSMEKLRALIDELIDGIKAGTVSTETVNNVYKLSNALSGVARARNEIQKTELETATRHHEAVSQILSEFMSELAMRPELYNELMPLIYSSAEQTDNRYKAGTGTYKVADKAGEQQEHESQNSNTPDPHIG